MDQCGRGAATASASGEVTLGKGWAVTSLGVTTGLAAPPSGPAELLRNGSPAGKWL